MHTFEFSHLQKPLYNQTLFNMVKLSGSESELQDRGGWEFLSWSRLAEDLQNSWDLQALASAPKANLLGRNQDQDQRQNRTTKARIGITGTDENHLSNGQ